MKIIINYDFFDAIRNVNEPYGSLKVIRNNKDKYLLYLPIWLAGDLVVLKKIPETILALMVEYGLLVTSDMLADIKTGIDIYATMSSKNLNKLVSELETINIKTDYELLKMTQLYDKKYTINNDKYQNKVLVEEKYFLLPTYNYKDDIKDTSIIQEHIIGTNKYALSAGSPKKSYRKVLAKT